MSRRPFSHLSKVEIRDIVASFYHGTETKLQLATRLGIDPTTVTYHIRKYEKSSLEEKTNSYSVVKREFHYVCAHPSLKCSLCGRHKDMIHAEGNTLIRQLQGRLKAANARLKYAGLAGE